MDADEDDKQHAEHDQKEDDPPAVPRMNGATPSQRKKQADDHRQENDRAVNVELLQLVLPSFLEVLCLRVLGWMVEELDEGHCDGTDWQVDVEAPSPGHFVGKSTAHERASD